tara:strand:+ start:1432 stop:1716 length:285 start_codon:yes stop_codon:yes gene_type:complete
MTRTFYFNTGVKPWNTNGLFGRQVWKDGTKQIPFECQDVPEGAVFLMGSSSEEVPSGYGHSRIIRREIKDWEDGLGMMSKYAYFRLPKDVTTVA